jgi:hypothetical protein
MLKPILIACSLLLLVPNFINRDINDQLAYDGKEKFEAGLVSLNSLDKLEAYIDRTATAQKIAVASPQYPLLVENIISRRFYHGFSHPSLSENFIAAVAEKNHWIRIGLQSEYQRYHGTQPCSLQSTKYGNDGDFSEKTHYLSQCGFSTSLCHGSAGSGYLVLFGCQHGTQYEFGRKKRNCLDGPS